MRIVIISNTIEHLRDLEHIRNYVLERVKDLDFHIICGGYDHREFTEKPYAHYLYRDFLQFLEAHRSATTEDLVKLQRAQATLIPSGSYKSDKRYIRKLAGERNLVLEQIYLVETVKKLFEDFHPELLFTTDGASTIKTVPFMVAQSLGIRCYRIYPEHFINPRGGLRYRFAPNNYRRFSEDPNDQFGYPADATEKHATEFLNSIIDDSYRLDETARSLGRDKVRLGQDNLKLLGWSLLNFRLAQFKHELRPKIDRMLNDRLATPPGRVPKPYFLFPLNWPEDAQLVVRAPQYQDTLSITEQIANVLPYGHTLVIKEHPGYPGMLDHYRLKAVLRSHRNIAYVKGSVRLQQLLHNASALITVNSTAAIEALLCNIPVITLGEAFYRDTGLTHDVGYLLELPQILSEAITEERDTQTTYNLLHYVICQFLQQTVPEPGRIINMEDRHNVVGDGIVNKVHKYRQGAF